MAEVAKYVYCLLVTILLGITVKEIFFTSEVLASVQKEIPQMKIPKFAGPTLQILYCYSCGYRKVFEQYADAFHEKFPELTVLGDNYTPPNYRLQLAQFCGIAKFVLILVIVAGFNPFTAFGLQSPGVFNWLITNKIYACMMIFFLCNALEGQLISTGAFEISFNGVPVWSKIETGRIPSPAELFQIIESNLRFSRVADS